MSKITCVVEDTLPIDRNLKNAHGVSFWIETGSKSILFDTGPDADLLAHNLAVLDLDIHRLDALALSHAHYDHTGGIAAVLPYRMGLPIFANPDIFQPRYSLRNGDYQSIGFSYTDEKLVRKNNLKLSDQPNQIAPGLWTSGEINERPEPMGDSDHHFIRKGCSWIHDPYRDDMSLVLETDAGLVLICGCCHAGLLNTLLLVKKKFDRPIQIVMGGTHLVSTDNIQLEHVISILQENYPETLFYLNHCTGETAISKLLNAFGERVKCFPAGSILEVTP